jgi:hypothetical protein
MSSLIVSHEAKIKAFLDTGSIREAARKLGVLAGTVQYTLKIKRPDLLEAHNKAIEQAKNQKWAERNQEAIKLFNDGIQFTAIFEQTRVTRAMLEDLGYVRVEEIPHGTMYAYAKGCRCDLCRAANAKTAKEQRAKRRAKLAGRIPE